MQSPARGAEDGSRLQLHTLAQQDARAGFAADVARGLQLNPKRLSPKYFYDELGSELFDAICLLPEYYLTRAEDEILTRHADEIVAAARGDDVEEPLSLLEFGSGSAVKTRQLIEALLRRQSKLLYLPIDISASALETSARVLLQTYPALRIEAYAGDYDTALAYLRQRGEGTNHWHEGRTLALFLGSNIGNFTPPEAARFLRALRDCLDEGDALLLGADLKKAPAALEAAYDDALGVTAAFNLNLLARINRELAADFNPRRFRHVARYNEPAGRVEIHLESLCAQVVHLAKPDLTVRFDAGEMIHSENSHKYALSELNELAARTGYDCVRTWLDEAGQFSSNLFCAVAGTER